MRRILCSRKHRMVEVTPNLFVCECSSYGSAAHLKGAVDEARRLADLAGGIDVLRKQVEAAEERDKLERKASSRERELKEAAKMRDGV